MNRLIAIVLKVLLPVLLLSIVTRVATAAPPRFASDADCATESAFRAELNRLLSEHSGKLDLDATVHVETVERQWRIKLVIRDGGERFVRMVHVDECALAPRVGALLIAITVDPALAAKFDAPEVLAGMEDSHPPPGPKEPASKPASMPRRKQPTGKERAHKKPTSPAGTPGSTMSNDAPKRNSTPEHPRLSVGVHANLNLGTLPNPAPGPGLKLGLQWKKWKFSLALDGSFSAPQQISGAQDGEFRTGLLTFSTGFGYTFGNNTFIFHPMLGIATASVFARTRNLPDNVEDTTTSFATWLGTDLYWFARERFGLYASAAMYILSNPPRYTVDGVGDIHEASRLAAFIQIGTFFTF